MFIYESFNINNPSVANIQFIFGELLFNLIGAIESEAYQKYKNKYKTILSYVEKWISIYIKRKKLKYIDFNEMEDIFDLALYLKDKLFLEEGNFQVMVERDIESLMLLRKSEILQNKGE